MYGDFELNIRVFLFAAECIGKGAAFILLQVRLKFVIIGTSNEKHVLYMCS